VACPGPPKFSDSVDHGWGALMQEPDLLLTDEPTSSLHPKTSVEIMEPISRRASESSIPAIVYIHNVELAHRYAARLMGSAESSLAAFLSARIGPHSRQYKCPSVPRTGVRNPCGLRGVTARPQPSQ
jgi:hypothetical protein